jgi:hypothetical protein
MRKNRPHYPDEKFLEYYYDREAVEEGFGEHLLRCPECSDRYLELERSLDGIKTAFREGREAHWNAQRQRIMDRLEETENPAPAMPWRKLAPLAAAALITITLIFSLNPKSGVPPVTDEYYSRLSRNDDLLLQEMQDLMDRPLTESLSTINFWMDRVEQQGDQSRSNDPGIPTRRVNNEAI